MSSIFISEFVSMLLKLMGFFLLGSLIFSVILMVTGKNVFFKLEKGRTLASIPVYNLLVLTEGLEIKPSSTILYFVPFINLGYYIYVIDRLGYVFKKDYDFRLGLVFFPFIFLPILGNDTSTLTRFEDERLEEEKQAVLGDMLLATDETYKEMNNQEVEEEKVNSIYKSNKEAIPEAPSYKAKGTGKQTNLDFDNIEGKHKIIFIPSDSDVKRRENVIKQVETSYIDKTDFSSKDNDINIYEIK